MSHGSQRASESIATSYVQSRQDSCIIRPALGQRIRAMPNDRAANRFKSHRCVWGRTAERVGVAARGTIRLCSRSANTADSRVCSQIRIRTCSARMRKPNAKDTDQNKCFCPLTLLAEIFIELGDQNILGQ